MVDIYSLADWAYTTIFDSPRGKGLPFGSYLHTTGIRRRRALTGPLDTSQDSYWHRFQVLSAVEPEQRTYLQDDCALLSRLPLDIRLLIYELVLGGKYFHVTTNEHKTRLLSHICRNQNTSFARPDDHQLCFAHPSPTHRPSSYPREDYPFATGLLPLLVTCRRIYSEAVPILYSANTFEFWENRVALRFLKIMLPTHRLSSIRHFRWDMQIPHHPNDHAQSRRDWNDLFAFFANETSGLQHLYLKLKKNHLVEAVIAQTRDEEAVAWIRPVVVMAVEAKRKRGCKVEIVVNGVVLEPSDIFAESEKRGEGREKVLEIACVEMHRRMRVAVGNG